MEFKYSEDSTKLQEYYADLRKQHEIDCEEFKKPADCHALGEFYEAVDKDFPK